MSIRKALRTFAIAGPNPRTLSCQLVLADVLPDEQLQPGILTESLKGLAQILPVGPNGKWSSK